MRTWKNLSDPIPIQILHINRSCNPLSGIGMRWKGLWEMSSLNTMIYRLIDKRDSQFQPNLPLFVTQIPLLPPLLPLHSPTTSPRLSQFNLHFTIYLIGFRAVTADSQPNPIHPLVIAFENRIESTGMPFLS